MSSQPYVQQPPTFFPPQAITRCCDPCANFEEDTEATATVRFVRNGEWFTMDVCPGHEQQWLDQFNDWTGCATKLGRQPGVLTHELAATDPELYRTVGDPQARHRLPSPPVPEQPDPRRMKVVPPEPVIKTGIVIDRDEPDYDQPVKGEIPLKVIREWSITDHAKQRMTERDIGIQEVWRALHQARRADMTTDGQGGMKLVVGDLCVVVAPEDKAVLTVWRPSKHQEAAAAAAALGGRF
jgi:hypothetical protein